MHTEISNSATVVYRDSAGRVVTASHTVKTCIVDGEDTRTKTYREKVEANHR